MPNQAIETILGFIAEKTSSKSEVIYQLGRGNIVYLSDGGKYKVMIRSASETTGKMAGTLQYLPDGPTEDLYEGNFHFYNEEGKTDLTFRTTGEIWRFTAPHYNGDRNFRVWYGTRSNTSDKNDIEKVKFIGKQQ